MVATKPMASFTASVESELRWCRGSLRRTACPNNTTAANPASKPPDMKRGFTVQNSNLRHPPLLRQPEHRLRWRPCESETNHGYDEPLTHVDTARLSIDGTVRVTIDREPDVHRHIEVSHDLTHWTTLNTSA